MNETTAYLGAHEVGVRFDFIPASDGPWPFEAQVLIEEVGIEGVWISAEYICPDWLADTERDILADKGRALQAEAAEEDWDRREEARMEGA